jgi:hypothetical protein
MTTTSTTDARTASSRIGVAAARIAPSIPAPIR